MARSSELRLSVRLNLIKDVADDLTRELVRLKLAPTNVVHAMAAFIKLEAEGALRGLKKGAALAPRRAPTRRRPPKQ